MPQTNPFHHLVPRKMTDSELARAIRLDLESELDAINLYAAHIDATDNQEAIRVIRHIMNEEKEHATLFFELLMRLDPDLAKEAETAGLKVRLLAAGASDEEVEAIGEGGAPESMGHPAIGQPRQPREEGLLARGAEAEGGPAPGGSRSPRGLTVGTLRRKRG